MFLLSFLIRAAWVIFSYFFYIAQTGIPFEFNTADAFSYHSWASAASDTFEEGGIAQFFESNVGYSDLGYPIYLTIVYYIFGDSIIIARLLFAIWGAWTVVLIYKIGRRNFDENTGRIAGIFALLLPNFIYYCGLHMKEVMMIFFLVAFMERADDILRGGKVTAVKLLIIGLLGAYLFFFRTVLALSAVFALFSALVLSKKVGMSWLNRMLITVWFLVVIWLFLSARVQNEIEAYYEGRDQQESNMEWRAKREGGNAFAKYGTTIVFVPLMFTVPFPTLVNIEIQQNQMLLAGGYFVRNVYAFFVILALITMYRKKLLRKHIFLLSFVFAYLFILAKSSFAISERFHLPAVPFLLILAAYGLTQINRKNKKYFIPYLVFIAIIIIGWNWFKLAGRGII